MSTLLKSLAHSVLRKLGNIVENYQCNYNLFARVPRLVGQIGDIFSLCQSEIGANWQINMSAKWHLTPIGANWRRKI